MIARLWVVLLFGFLLGALIFDTRQLARLSVRADQIEAHAREVAAYANEAAAVCAIAVPVRSMDSGPIRIYTDPDKRLEISIPGLSKEDLSRIVSTFFFANNGKPLPLFLKDAPVVTVTLTTRPN